MGTRHFECRTFDLSDNSPIIYFNPIFAAQKSFKKILGRKSGEKAKNYSIFYFENPVKSRAFRRTKLPDVAKISSATSSTSLSTSPYDTFYSLYIIAKVLKAVNRCGGKSAKTLPCFPLSPLDSGRSLHYNNADSFFTFETAIFRRFHSF